ncbi:BnaC06g07050D [Brassica napus]|uniref:BnaC06g07050D protein n=1 Tax=Brassica napus TaxID=3708 RepID=A0A078H6E8_BRANA|nr:BnaC06g07050D [Brassica napus]
MKPESLVIAGQPYGGVLLESTSSPHYEREGKCKNRSRGQQRNSALPLDVHRILLHEKLRKTLLNWLTPCVYQLKRQPVISRRKVRMTSSHHAPYALGDTRATMAEFTVNKKSLINEDFSMKNTNRSLKKGKEKQSSTRNR